MILAVIALLAAASAYFVAVSLAGADGIAGEREAPRFTLGLFYQYDTIVPGRANEFVVKIGNATAEEVEVVYAPLSTEIVDATARKTRPPNHWNLVLLVDIEGKPTAFDPSGRVESASADVPSRQHSLILFNPPGNRLPGDQLRMWAELRSPDGSQVYRSNELRLRRAR